jgi:(p)ppGpp synthase/HD superfamily hydrolase
MAGLGLIAAAAHHVARAHAGQRRKGPGDVPYFNHPAEVAAEVAAAGAGEAAVAAALLHDVLEDTAETRAGLEARFGAEAAGIVAELTDAPEWEALPLSERKARQAAHARGISPEARRVKIADQAANLRDRCATPEVWAREKLAAYLTGARAIVDAVRGVDAHLEAGFDAAAEALQAIMAGAASPRARGLEAPGRAPGLDAAGIARAETAAAALHAARRHAGQRRQGAAGEPYATHVAEVAARVGRAHPGDGALIRAALLHDAVEDTEETHEGLAARFGAEVAGLVAEVTDDKALPKAERKRLAILHAPGRSARAKRLKLADLAANLDSLAEDPPPGWSRDRRIAYLDWARRVAEGCRDADAGLAGEFDSVAARLEAVLGAGAPASTQ